MPANINVRLFVPLFARFLIDYNVNVEKILDFMKFLKTHMLNSEMSENSTKLEFLSECNYQLLVICYE